MQRGHDTEQIYRVAEQARAVRSDVALTSDFIVGFPGETDAEHAETLAMVERIGFAQLHVFPFSPREGTHAAGLPGQVHGQVKKQRAAALRELGKRCRRDFLETQMGKTVQVLVETRERGLSGNYIRLAVPGGSEGSIHKVRVQTDNILQ
jgi:threonylcarbamoyladenosine tRNA methylthiotransferase MtaB